MSRSTSLNTGVPATDLGYLVSQNIYKTFSYDTPLVGTADTIAVGTLPSGARVTRLVVFIDTAFNAATTNEIQVGTSADADAYVEADDVDLTVTGAVEVTDRIAVTTFSSDTTVYLQYDQTGTAATAGAGAVLIEYIVP